MYEIIKAVIESGRFELADMIKKIDTMWLQGGLMDDQRTELVELARGNADPANSYAGVRQQLDALFAKQADLAKEVAWIKDEIASLQGGTVDPAPEPDEWPEYVQPTGAHDAYKMGDRVSYKGNHYICKMAGCVWAPDVYPAAWDAAE